MAEAYGKLTGRPGVAIVTRGPGACHAAIGVHVAFQDSTPLVLLVGQIPSRRPTANPSRKSTTAGCSGPLAKWVTQIDDEKRIPELMAHAFDVATSGGRGRWWWWRSARRCRSGSPPCPISAGRCAAAAPRPRCAAARDEDAGGGRAPAGGAGRVALERAGQGRYPRLAAGERPAVSVAFRRMGLFDGTSPNYVGDLGVGADAGLVAKAKESDLILAIGTRIGEPVSQATRCSTWPADADRACLSGPGGDRARLSPRARHRVRTERLRPPRPRRRAR